MLWCNQPIFVFLWWTAGSLIPSLLIAGIFVGIGSLVMFIKAAKIREGDARAGMKPLCVWEYSVAEWQKYAGDYNLAKFPKGAARVQATLLDVWITDDGMVRRTILDDTRKCVTACKFEKQVLKIRIRSWAIPGRFGSVVHSVQDVCLPVPVGYEREALEVAKFFNENIARMHKKVASVMPDGFLNGAIGEFDF